MMMQQTFQQIWNQDLKDGKSDFRSNQGKMPPETIKETQIPIRRLFELYYIVACLDIGGFAPDYGEIYLHRTQLHLSSYRRPDISG